MKSDETQREEVYLQEKLILDVSEELYRCMEDAGFTKASLSRKLGKSTSYVSQVLNSDRSITIRTLATFATALDVRVQITLAPCEKGAGT